MRYRKATLYVIIFFLVLFIPITIFSTVKTIEKITYVENPTHKFHFENKLYFYDGDKILGRYYCQTSNCNLAVSKVVKDDSIILKEYIPPVSLEIKPINNKYAFIVDSETENFDYILYDITAEKELARYKEIKNYSIGLDNNIFIVKNMDNKYGMISLQNDIQLRMPFTYDYIGTNYKLNPETNKISTTSFATKKDNVWQILSDTESTLSTTFTDDIYNYNENYIVFASAANNMYYVTNYNGDRILNNNYSYLDFYENYLVMLDNFHNFSMYNLKTSIESDKHIINTIEDVTLTTVDGYVNVTINNEVVEKLAIS